jgi:hypothetical protein
MAASESPHAQALLGERIDIGAHLVLVERKRFPLIISYP